MGFKIHPFPPVWDEHSKILVLGSFPSVIFQETGFYYGNPKNRFWMLLEAVFKERVPPDIQGRRAYLLNHHIALWDVLASCDIAGSSDASIRNPVPNNLDEIFNTAVIRCVLANGQLASRAIMKFYSQLTLGKLLTLLFTSPANVSWSLERLVETWSSALLH